MIDLFGKLTVYAEDELISGFSHARLIAKDTIGLYPMPFTLQVRNLSSSDYFLICAAREISVRRILNDADTGIRLLFFPGPDSVRYLQILQKMHERKRS